jgi:RNA polymerase sigma-70 factor, ECF subfamily
VVTPSDAQLVEQVLRGSQDAYRALMGRHATAVFNVIARIVRDAGAAEELAQDTFVKAFGALRSFDPAYKFTNWILRIAHNTAIDHLRRRRPDTISIDEESPGQAVTEALIDDREASPFDRAAHADLREDLEAAMATLRPEYRRLVVMRYLEDLSYEDIADILDLPMGTVKSHLHRARAEMARAMARGGWGPGGAAPEAAGCNPQPGPARRTE